MAVVKRRFTSPEPTAQGLGTTTAPIFASPASGDAGISAAAKLVSYDGGLFKTRPSDERVWVGLDPSLTGYAMVAVNEDNEWQGWRLSTSADQPLGWRAFDIENFLRWKLQELDLRRFSVTAVCVEAPSFASVFQRENAGVVKIVTAMAFIKVFGFGNPLSYPYSVAPASLKKWVTGSGAAGGKDQLTKELLKRYGIDAPNNDLADAAGLATVARGLTIGAEPKFQAEVLEVVRKNTEWKQQLPASTPRTAPVRRVTPSSGSQRRRTSLRSPS